MTILKTTNEISKMRAAGKIAALVLDSVKSAIRPGITIKSLDSIANKIILDAGASPLFLGVVDKQAIYPFPASICASINEEIIHGIPDERFLQTGDIISIDVGVKLDGYCADTARTFTVGMVSAPTRRLVQVTQKALDLAIASIKPGLMWSDTAKLIQNLVESNGFGIIREFVGHGVGQEMHEEPKVPNFFDPTHEDFEIAPGMTFAIEPMVSEGSPKICFRDRSKWTIITEDRSMAAHFEHTIAVNESGAEILTNSV